MPWYEVVVKASQVIAVEADSPGEAAEFAFDEAFGTEECNKECDHPTAAVEGVELDRLKRHADVVLPIEEED